MRFRFACLALALLLPASPPGAESALGTRAERAALHAWLVERTLAREAFSEIKHRNENLDIPAALQACREEIVNATDEAALWYGLLKLSNARQDRHLWIAPLPGGPSPEAAFARRAQELGWENLDRALPLRLEVDFSDPAAPLLFVAETWDFPQLSPGDVVVAVNGRSVPEFVAWARPYHRFSTTPHLWVLLAQSLPLVHRDYPPDFYHARLSLRVRRENGHLHEARVPYLPRREIRRPEAREDRYEGFSLARRFVSFDVYQPERGQRVILLDWHGFQPDLRDSMDAFMEMAEARAWLDYDLILDLTHSRGGSQGAYALRRLSPRPFRTTFGNLRLSDVTEPFIQTMLRDYERRRSPATPEHDPRWLLDWLTGDVRKGLAAGQAYSNSVPFKCAHLPPYSDGVMTPHARHFRGRLTAWLYPRGGSHLDQFAAMIADNELGWTLGMPAGGFSNTWEWTEDVKFPASDRPVVRFMWSIGHTIRPNGQVLEGNPAAVDEWFPITRENFRTHRAELLERSLARLAERK